MSEQGAERDWWINRLRGFVTDLLDDADDDTREGNEFAAERACVKEDLADDLLAIIAERNR